MRRLSGFSLMEMMIVLLIVAVVAAASAPMINKKMLSRAAEESPWVWTGLNNNITYNLDGAAQTASIGAVNPPENAGNARLYLQTNAVDPVPQLALGDGTNTLRIRSMNNSIVVSNNNSTFTDSVNAANSVVIGPGQRRNIGNQAVSIGVGSNRGQANATIAIGTGASAMQVNGIAMGSAASSMTRCIAIGTMANVGESNNAVTTSDSIAIGTGARVSQGINDAIAIGHSTSSNAVDSIVIGREAGTRNALAEGAIAIGTRANANTGAIVIGHTTLENPRDRALGNHAVSIGTDAQSRDRSNIAIGRNSIARFQGAIAIGGEIEDGFSQPNDQPAANANAVRTIAIGSATAEHYEDIAIGTNVRVNVDNNTEETNSVAIGSDSSTVGGSNVVIGNNVTAGTNAQHANDAIAIGHWVQAGARGVSIGAESEAAAFTDNGQGCAVAVGYNANAREQGTVAIGSDSNATHWGSIAIGHWNNNSGNGINRQGAVSIGWGTNADAPGAIALGFTARATAANAIALGNAGENAPGASGIGSIAIGAGSRATSRNSVAIGTGVVSDGENTIVLGNNDWTVVAGNINASNIQYQTLTQESDRRLKNVGEVFKAGLAEIKKLEVFNYTFKKDKDKKPRVGVMAQDLEKVFPNAVTKGDDGFLRIRMEDMFYAVINAIKELDAKIEKLMERQKKIDELEKRIDKLEKRLAALEKAVKD